MKNSSLSSATDTVVGLSEVALDSLLDESVLRDIPILGSAVGIARAASSLRDKLFLRRIAAFVRGCRSSDEPQTPIDIDDEESLSRAGDALLLILETASSEAKASMMGQLFRSLARKEITIHFFERALESVGSANTSDLKLLLKEVTVLDHDQRDHMRNLSNQGFTRPYGDDTLENMRSIYFELTEFGRGFLRVMGKFIPNTEPLGLRDDSAEPTDLAKIYENAVTTGKTEW